MIDIYIIISARLLSTYEYTKDVQQAVMAKSRPLAAIRIDPELWKKAKIEAIKRDMTVTDLVTVALEKEISRSTK